MARVTESIEDKKQKYITVGYYPTKKDGMEALAHYRASPYKINNDVTFGALWDEWKKYKYQSISLSRQKGYNQAWNYLKQYEALQFSELRIKHYQELFINIGRDTANNIKSALNMLYQYAITNDIVDRNYADLLILPKKDAVDKVCFTDKEIKALFENTDIKYVDTILIMIYTGMRIGELLTLKRSNVDIKSKIITHGIKTEAGMNRIIPISVKILPYVEKWMIRWCDYLIHKDGKRITEDYYRKHIFSNIKDKLQLNEKLSPHCARHTFATMLQKSNVDTLYIQRLIGHASYSTTANVYTHPEIAELAKVVNII